MLMNLPEEVEQEYPPDTLFRYSHIPIRFNWVAILAVFIFAIIDYIANFQITSVPYNYPFYFDVILSITGILILSRTHKILDSIKIYLVNKASEPAIHPHSSRSLSSVEIRADYDRILENAYNPYILLISAIFFGILINIVLWSVDILNEYPYFLMNFIFGAIHGMFVPPVLFYFYLIFRGPQRYIHNFSIIDTSGVGGFDVIGEYIVKVATYGMYLITLDFIILSSVSFTGIAEFRSIVIVAYLSELAVLISMTFYGSYQVRKRLTHIVELKEGAIEREFVTIESEYWRKLERGNERSAEALDILALLSITNELEEATLWPIDFSSLTRLAISVVFSLAVFSVQLSGVILS
jgi:hypothetical protein